MAKTSQEIEKEFINRLEHTTGKTLNERISTMKSTKLRSETIYQLPIVEKHFRTYGRQLNGWRLNYSTMQKHNSISHL